VPQVASRVGGVKDFLDDGSALLCEEVYRYYVDESRDHVGGEAQLVDPYDVYNAIEIYYKDSATASKHGLAARAKIAATPEYSWDRLAERFSDILHEVHSRSPFGRPAEASNLPATPAPTAGAGTEPKAEAMTEPEAEAMTEPKAEAMTEPKAEAMTEPPKVEDISALRSEISELKQMLLEAIRSKA
jgi:hypothetical protein